MRNVIRRIVDYAARISDPEEIILFGSMANGTSNVHSDIDLLIILRPGSADAQIGELVRKYAQESALTADILVYSRDDIERNAHLANSFLAGVLQGGKIVYKDNKIL